MPRQADYTVAEAARRVGLTPDGVRKALGSPDFQEVPGTSPALLKGGPVDARRARELARFEDVVDLSFEVDEPRDIFLERTRRMEAEQWMHDIVASQRMLDEGVDLVRKSRDVVVGSLMSALPVEPPNSAAPGPRDP